MDWKRAMEQEWAALIRVVALLHALADLAESAACASAPVRGFVLWLLGHAETVARDFVVGEDDDDALPSLGRTGSRPDDAMRLSERLRALALLLDIQATMMLVAGDGDGETPVRRDRRMAAFVAVTEFVGRASRRLSQPPALAGSGPRRAVAPDTS